MDHMWKVVPLSPGQRKDVRDEDVLECGLFRLCHTYRGGGGYDQFPSIARHKCIVSEADQASLQFIVQLQGCNLDCPYCYVTREGVWEHPVKLSTKRLVEAFGRSGAQVFHLMGGAPALQMKYWPELMEILWSYYPQAIFHSDLMLSESWYDFELLSQIAYFGQGGALFAINIKGLTADEWLHNTRKPWNEEQFWYNWHQVEQSGLPAYVTFTGCDPALEEEFWQEAECYGLAVSTWRKHAYHIGLIEYDAQPYVDRIPWGGRPEATDEEDY